MTDVSATNPATNPATKAATNPATNPATAATVGSTLVEGSRACLVAGRRIGRRGQLKGLDVFVGVL